MRRKKSLNLRRLALRGLLSVGLLPRLLIPVGFMPAAFADGGPIAICGDYGWVASAAYAGLAVPMGHADHADQAMHAGMDHHGPHAAADTTLAAAADEPGQEHEQHRQWERCAFAGAASSAPLVADWHLDLLSPAGVSLHQTAALPFAQGRILSFRSRAPPGTHS
jgi:hypothetical protein